MWQQASGCETGQIWPRKDGKVIWGACKGEVGRYNVRHRAGEALLGLPAEPLRPRSGRNQVPLPAADRRLSLAARRQDRLSGVARAASLDRRRRDVADDQPGPHGARAAVSDRPGQPDHPRHHRRRGLFVDLLDDRVASREGRDLGRRQRRAGERHARQRQDLEERHAEGPRAGRARADASKTRRIAAARPTSSIYRLPARARPEAVRLQDRPTTARPGRS